MRWADASIYKQRYENTRRELEFMKKKLQQQVEDEVEQHMSAKKAFDKKVSFSYWTFRT